MKELEDLIVEGEDYLQHYGVLGMKWGVRKAETRERYRNKVDPKQKYDGKPGTATKAKSDRSSDTEESKKKGLSDKQKRNLKIGAAVAVTTIAAVGAYQLYKNGKLDSLIEQGKDMVGSGVDAETGLPKLGVGGVKIKTINPKFNMMDLGTTMNCGNCTIATELQNRGLNVKAKSNASGMTTQQLAQYFKLPDKDSIKTIPFNIDTITPGKELSTFKDLLVKDFPDGARGSIFVPHSGGSHFMNFEIKGGKSFITDAQNPKLDIQGFFETVDTTFNPAGKKLGGIQTVRLDNAEVNTIKIREVIASAKKGFVDAGGKATDKFNVDQISGDGFVLNDYMKLRNRTG